MKKQIEEMYKKQRNSRAKAGAICILVFVMTMGIISIFFGNPFPHKGKILLLTVTYPGWIISDTYLLFICCIIAYLVSAGNAVWTFFKPFCKIDQVLLQQCDAKYYLELMEYAVTYGKSLKLKGTQKVVFTHSEQNYVTALIANQYFGEAESYLNEKWVGKRNRKWFKQAATTLSLSEKYAYGEAESFCMALRAAGAPIAKNRLMKAKAFFLKQDYESAVKILEQQKEKLPYKEVGRQLLLGKCYDKLGNSDQAIACMKYVVENANTMPHKEWAQKWLSQQPSSFNDKEINENED